MKKSAQERLNASLDKALAPPRQKPKQNLDALLDEYDDGMASIPSTIPVGIPTTIPSGIPKVKTTLAPPQQVTKESDEQTAPLDATHTAAERSVYSIMYRETVSKGLSERHFGPAELMKKTGIRSRNTVHKALYGLTEKFSVEVVADAIGNPLGPRYRVHKPQTIEQRRRAAGLKIDPQSKRIIECAGIPAGIPPAIAKNWDTTRAEIGIPTIPNSGIVFKYINDDLAAIPNAVGSSSNSALADDEAFATLVELFKQATTNLTGKPATAAERDRWREFGELIVAELQIAAARTGQVSNVPAFLTEHLRRRLWKKDKAQLDREEKEAPKLKAEIDASKCPDCGGSGWWYPEGSERGVAKCRHEKLKQDE